jgi:hypothetical protein
MLSDDSPVTQAERDAVQKAVDILLSDQPTHQAVILLRSVLGQDVFGDRVDFDAKEIGITLNQEREQITRVPDIGKHYFK